MKKKTIFTEDVINRIENSYFISHVSKRYNDNKDICNITLYRDDFDFVSRDFWFFMKRIQEEALDAGLSPDDMCEMLTDKKERGIHPRYFSYHIGILELKDAKILNISLIITPHSKTLKEYFERNEF